MVRFAPLLLKTPLIYFGLSMFKITKYFENSDHINSISSGSDGDDFFEFEKDIPARSSDGDISILSYLNDNDHDLKCLANDPVVKKIYFL